MYFLLVFYAALKNASHMLSPVKTLGYSVVADRPCDRNHIAERLLGHYIYIIQYSEKLGR